jgi:hypothetical protein
MNRSRLQPISRLLDTLSEILLVNSWQFPEIVYLDVLNACLCSASIQLGPIIRHLGKGRKSEHNIRVRQCNKQDLAIFLY